MPTAIISSDWHLEAGSKLGVADAVYGNSRLRDAKRILDGICTDPADVLIFAGDLGHTRKPGPVAYAIAAEALSCHQGDTILIPGNHDHTGEAATCVDVVARGIHPGGRVAVAHTP